MALNIPVNLMSTAAPALQTQTTSAATVDTAAIQPAGAAADTRGASTGGGNSAGSGTGQQTFLAPRKAPQPKPDRAAPNSVVTAQAQSDLPAAQGAKPGMDIARTKAFTDSVAASAATNWQQMDRPKKVDRYAPPDPLPTAPILKGKAPRPAETPPA